jgi:hypothetical protein
MLWQTDGDPLPTLAHDTTGDPGIHLAALEQAITAAGVVVTRLADLGGAHGYSQLGGITILESLTPAEVPRCSSMRSRTCCFTSVATPDRRPRQCAKPNPRPWRIVSAAIGIRSRLDATDYIQLHDGNADTLCQSLHRIQATAKTILSALRLEAPAVAAHQTTRIAC